MRICRLCLYRGDEKQVLSVWENHQIEDLATKIQNCVAVRITREDLLPTWACLSCIHQITQWEIFRQTCQKSNEILLQGISKSDKLEDTEQKKPLIEVERENSNDKLVIQDSKLNILRDIENVFVKIRDDTTSQIVKNPDSQYSETIVVNIIDNEDQVTEITELENVEIIKEEEDYEEPPVKQRIREYKKIPKVEYIVSDDSDEDVYKEDDTECLDVEFLDLEAEYSEHTYQCEICTNEFRNCFEYLDHQESHDGDFIFQCDKCPELFNTRKTLVEHDKNHRTACPQCGKLVLKSSMKLHLIKHTDKYKCKQCNGRFNSKAALSQHVITVHTNIKDHICEMCGKQFSSQTAMRVHMRSHSDERLYPCKLCHYAGRTASAIYVHMSTHANDSCVCEICSKTFKSTRNLNDHLRRVHSKIKKHECIYCDKKFVDKYMLSVHLRCHTGVRPYQCTMCDKAFIRSDGLKEHMTIHGQRTLFDCKVCGKKFASKRGVTRHNCVPA